MKKWLAILTAFLLSVPFAVSPAFAAEASLPTEDPNYVEQSLEDFLKENPNYQGYPDVERYTAEPAADTQEWYEWTQSGSSWYLYRKYYDGTTIVSTKMINYWYQDSSTGNWYFLKPSTGEMAVGWCQVGKYWYYFNAGGIMQIDWYEVDNVWYYFRTGTVVDLYGGPEGGALSGEYFIPASRGSTTCTQNYYFDYYCKMREWTYPLPTSLVSGISSSNYEPYYVNSCFAEWRDLDGDGKNEDCHNGLDLRARVPVSVVSCTSGTVVTSQLTSSMGELIVVKTDIVAPNQNNLYVRYMHLSERDVFKNDSISTGTFIGKTGNTGNVAAHFHMDVNAHNITTSTVTGNVQSTMGQNPAAFFPNITWKSKVPYSKDYSGYLSN